MSYKVSHRLFLLGNDIHVGTQLSSVMKKKPAVAVYTPLPVSCILEVLTDVLLY